ncbi:hypothetical protein DENSPDRAFT_785166 [Dentipellis sp. KUC8613]|nr:hypothetical protein DENSPDRAFT_785166 [Dentipellis sp. KUC8613]
MGLLTSGAIILGWQYLPDFATRGIIQLIKPRVSFPITQWHYRVIFSLVVLSYLLHNFFVATLGTPPSYYDLLKVTPEVDESGLKSAFRTFAKRNHPDRVGPDGAATFIAVRAGYEALMDPTKRWAYDRFGPDFLYCRDCTTHHDYLQWGLGQSLVFHVMAFLVLLIFSAIGYENNVSFWRYFIFFALAISEVCLILSPPLSSKETFPQNSHILSYIFPTQVPFQHILFLHEVFVFTTIALSRLAPVLFPEGAEEASISKLAQAVADRVKSIDSELYTQLQAELLSIQPSHSADESTGVPNAADADTMDTLTREMENMIIEGRLAHEGGDIAKERTEALRRHRTFSLPLSGPAREETPLLFASPRKELGARWPNPLAPARESTPQPGGSRTTMPGTYKAPTPELGYMRARSKSC